MTERQNKLFWLEVEQIQVRNRLFFPDEQKQFIKASYTDNGSVLTFLEGYDLPECITLEIQFAWKMAKM